MRSEVKSETKNTGVFEPVYLKMFQKHDEVLELITTFSDLPILTIKANVAGSPSFIFSKSELNEARVIVQIPVQCGANRQTINVSYNGPVDYFPSGNLELVNVTEVKVSEDFKRVDFTYSNGNEEVHHVFEINMSITIIIIRKPITKSPIFQRIPPVEQLSSFLSATLSRRSIFSILSDIGNDARNKQNIETIELMKKNLSEENLINLTQEAVDILSTILKAKGKEVDKRTLAAIVLYISIETAQLEQDDIQEIAGMESEKIKTFLNVSLYTFMAIAQTFGVSFLPLKIFDKNNPNKEKIISQFLPLTESGMIVRVKKGKRITARFIHKSKNSVISPSDKPDLTGEILTTFRLIDSLDEIDLKEFSLASKPFLGSYTYEKNKKKINFWRIVDPLLAPHSSSFVIPDIGCEVINTFNGKIKGYHKTVPSYEQAVGNVVVLRDEREAPIYKYLSDKKEIFNFVEKGYTYTGHILCFPDISQIPSFIGTIDLNELHIREKREKETIEETEEVIRKIDFLQDLKEEERDDVAGRLKLLLYSEGVEIIKQGDVGDSFYIIKSGEVEVISRDENGKVILTKTQTAGDFFGEISALTGDPRSATITSKTRVELYMLNKADFEFLLNKYKSLDKKISQKIAERLEYSKKGVSKETTDNETQKKVDSLSSQLLGKIGSFFFKKK